MRTHLIALIIFVAVGGTVALSAHHGTGIAYDNSKPTVVSGTVKEFSWTNPHSHLILEVKNAAGEVSEYAVEMNSPGVMIRQGWTKRQFKTGDQVQITVFPSKAGTAVGSCIGTCKVMINGVDNTPKTEIRQGL